MKYFYDLHVHTALSPCGQPCMKPNEILKQADNNGLDFIAICDHNSIKQLETFNKIKDKYNVIVVPGIEVTVTEGYHVVCLFETFDEAFRFEKVIENNLNPIFHDLTKLGEQVVFDEFDQVKTKITMVSYQQNTKLNVALLRSYINNFKGIMFLAHIERYDEKIYGKVDNEYKNMFDLIEINARSDAESILKNHSNLDKYTIIRDSDAHSLEIINDRKYYIELENNDIKTLLKELKKENR